MGKRFIEASELPEGEKVYLAKDRMGWRVIEPWVDPETGKVNYFAGTKKMIPLFLFVLLIMTLFITGYKESTESLRTAWNDVLNNPDKFCQNFYGSGNVCTPELRSRGLCLSLIADLSNFTNVTFKVVEGSNG